jgi:intracellular septation protein A
MTASTPLDRGRVVAYAVFWLPPLAVIFYLVPDYVVVSRRVYEQGELPIISVLAVDFVRFSLTFFYVPAAAAFLFVVAGAEVMRFALRRTERLAEVVWRLLIIGVAVFLWLMALSPVIVPIYGSQFRLRTPVTVMSVTSEPQR